MKMKRLLGLALMVSIFMLGGCVYGPGYYQRPAVVYDDGSVRNNAPVADGPVADGDYGYAYDDGYYAPGYYYGGAYGPWCCYGGWYPWIGVGFYGGYHGFHGHGGGWHGGGGHGGGGHWSGGGHSSGHH
jgi:hypothetical protein